jgi:alkanesulfonate monooxygenase SsuD/methylene tetrahydromethanopterin reductase-like flavin-dependent oxidoreductase (luciferase family)
MSIISHRVKFGVRIHQRGYDFGRLREIWVEADRLGYYSATLIDLLNAPLLECWTTLSALAPLTNQIRLTPLVLAASYRPPALLAKMASTLDRISNGRLELGIGAGGSETDHLASGFPFLPSAEQVAKFEEVLAGITSLWKQDQPHFAGKYYTFADAYQAPGPVQRPHPPILIGGHGERYLMRAMARYADIANIGFEMSLEEYARKRAVLTTHCQQNGRDPSSIELSHNTRVLIAPTQVALEERIRLEAQRAGQPVEAYQASLARAVVGTPEECVVKLTPYVESGICYFFIIFSHPIQLSELRLFAEAVMARF